MSDSQARQVKQFVQSLERDDRYIVLMYYADGLTPMEISRVLDLPSNKVRQRLQELRSELAGLAPRPAAAPTATIGHHPESGGHAAYA